MKPNENTTRSPNRGEPEKSTSNPRSYDPRNEPVKSGNREKEGLDREWGGQTEESAVGK
jgi:hypothetical protein